MEYKSEYPGVIHFELKDHVAYLKLDNPKTLNALSYDMFMSINEIFDNIAMDDEVWGVIITGEGRSFVAGADLSDKRMQGANFNGVGYQHNVRRHIIHDSMERVVNCEKPVIAAINGYCLGGGAELAACCDFRFADENAKIGYPEVKLGGIPAYLGVTMAMRIMNPASAKEMLFTAKKYTAAEAKELGFISRICPAGTVMDEAEKLMREILKNAPIAVRMCKICADKCLEMSKDAAYETEALITGFVYSTEDYKEGHVAFHEKREPQFKNR